MTQNNEDNSTLSQKFSELKVNNDEPHRTHSHNSTPSKSDQAQRKAIQTKEKELEEQAKFLLGSKGQHYYRPKRKAKYLDFNEAAEQMRKAEEREQAYIRQAKQKMTKKQQHDPRN